MRDGGFHCVKISPTANILRSATLYLLLLLALPLHASAAADETKLQQQRELYTKATKALARGDTATFHSLRQQLLDYPLLPYLDYADLSSRIRQAKPEEIDKFLNHYADIAATPWLRQRWLKQLAAKKEWDAFLAYYDENLKSVDLSCFYAYAQYVHGDHGKGVELGKRLWRAGESRPKACDPLFALLIEEHHIDDSVAWERYTAAIFNHNYSLANYISRFFSREITRKKAALYREVDNNPRVITRYEKFSDNTPEESRILTHGITHLARIDAQLALKVWNRYHQTHQFRRVDEDNIVSTLIRSLYIQDHRKTADQYFFQVEEQITDEVLDWRLREFVREADWQGIVTWTGQLNDDHRGNSRIKYWRARSLELVGNHSPATSSELYGELASERSFYGFLASEWLNKPYSMENQPAQVSAEQINQMVATPAFQRIRELYFHRELNWARREWSNFLGGKDESQWVVAAKVAEQWGWHNQAIMSMIQAQYWNDIDVRFPVPYEEQFLTQARATAIPVNLLLALSRQESAFNPQVTSPAGAKGLMQLMPATARETARKNNIRYSGAKELEHPDKNILIGSRYYKQMLDRFSNNRILATAAYNAGPRRVDSWRRQSDGKLPFDAWIEVIPFRETRNYVQNVLAFSIIYAHHLGLDVGLLSPAEKNTPL